MSPQAQHGDGAGLVWTVSTVKDTPQNLELFVSRNLDAGADHMLLFVDDADPEIMASLAGRPHVTVVGTGEDYWRGQRPPGLNARQVINANLASTALCAVPRVHWLFHLDGDEQLHLDKSRLLGLPEHVDIVGLTTLEAVSRRHQEGPVTAFKRPLSHEELCLLTSLGAIARPDMFVYFRGHLRKVGARPNLGRRIHIHRVEDNQRTELELYEAPWLEVLHYESHSGEEFVRKWLSHLSSGGSHLRPNRDVLRNAIAAVVRNQALTDAQRRELLETLYHRHIEDDVELLDRLGFLVRPPLPRGATPTPLDEVDHDVLRRCLAHYAAADKRHFAARGVQRRPAGLAAAFRDQLGFRDRLLKDRLARALAAERQAASPSGSPGTTRED